MKKDKQIIISLSEYTVLCDENKSLKKFIDGDDVLKKVERGWTGSTTFYFMSKDLAFFTLKEDYDIIQQNERWNTIKLRRINNFINKMYENRLFFFLFGNKFKNNI